MIRTNTGGRTDEGLNWSHVSLDRYRTYADIYMSEQNISLAMIFTALQTYFHFQVLLKSKDMNSMKVKYVIMFAYLS